MPAGNRLYKPLGLRQISQSIEFLQLPVTGCKAASPASPTVHIAKRYRELKL